MNDRNNSFIDKTLNMYKHLFPNEKLHVEISNYNASSARMNISVILKGMLLIILLTIVIFLVLPKSASYIVLTSVFYLVMLLLVINLIKINRPKKVIFNNQINLLMAHMEKNRDCLFLHQNYQKYYRKWNFIYGCIIIITITLSVLLFISDIISTGNTTLAPIFILLVFMLILFIPTIITNFFSFKKFVNKQHKIIIANSLRF